MQVVTSAINWPEQQQQQTNNKVAIKKFDTLPFMLYQI